MSVQDELDSVFDEIGRRLKALGQSVATSLSFNPLNSITGRLFGFLAGRNNSPVTIVFTGSSTTSGGVYVTEFGAALKAAYPLSSGSHPANSTSLTLAPSNGINIRNAGVSGATANDFLTATTAPQVAALSPALVSIMIGANDFGSESADALTNYKANLHAKLTYLKFANPNKRCIYLLAHTYVRMDRTNNVYTWDQFAEVLRQLADADPSNVVAQDASKVFESLGVPGSDPLDLISPDNLHPNNSGHFLLADLLKAFLLDGRMWGQHALGTPLVALTAPTLSGTFQVGSALSINNGTWDATPTSITRRWYRNGELISGATGTSYTLVDADGGKAISVTVTATIAGKTSSVASSVPVMVAAAADTTAPTISSFSAVAGDKTVTLSWDGSDNVGITKWTIKRVSPAATLYEGLNKTFQDTGLTNDVTVEYTADAYDANGNTVRATVSAKPVAATQLTNTAVPAISPTSGVAGSQVFTTTNGSWSLTPDSYTYQWRLAGVAISGQTGSSYTSVAGDAGKEITVAVTAIKSGYSNVTAVSTGVTPSAPSSGGSDYTTGMIFDFDPDDLVSLGDSAKIASWNSKAGSAGTLQVVNATAASQPTLKLNSLNGHAVVKFDASASTRLKGTSDAAPVVPGTGATYVLLLKRGANGSRLIGGSNTSTYHTFYDPAGNGKIAFAVNQVASSGQGTMIYTTAINDRWVLLIAVAAGSSSKLLIGDEATLTGILTTENGVGIAIGGSGSGTGYGTFDLARYRAYDHAFTDAEIATIKTQFKDRYALA